METFYSTGNSLLRHDRCQNCKSFLKRVDFLCYACRKIQDFSKYSYFDVFSDYEPSPKGMFTGSSTADQAKQCELDKRGTFDVDLGKLKVQFYKLQQKYHPDNASNNVDLDKANLKTISSFLNQAYNTLRDPFNRANYLMTLNGSQNPVDIEECSIEQERRRLDPEFLAKILEYHELIETQEVSSSAVQQICKEATEEIQNCIELFKKCFGKNDLDGCFEVLGKWKYWKNLVDVIKGN